MIDTSKIKPEKLKQHVLKSDLIATEKLYLEMLIDSVKWFSVKERLPEEIDGESKAVLAIVKFVDFCGNVWSNNYIIAWTEHREWACKGIVTHWMPLPEPPEQKGESEA